MSVNARYQKKAVKHKVKTKKVAIYVNKAKDFHYVAI